MAEKKKEQETEVEVMQETTPKAYYAARDIFFKGHYYSKGDEVKVSNPKEAEAHPFIIASEDGKPVSKATDLAKDVLSEKIAERERRASFIMPLMNK